MSEIDVLRQQLIEIYDARCAYCHSPIDLTTVTFEVEHIVPRNSGGQTTLDNLCLACPSCNRFKAARMSALDPETGNETLFFNPRSDTWVEHFAWNESKTHLRGLTAAGRVTIEAFRINRMRMTNLRALWNLIRPNWDE